ncbi:MAG TPA: acetylxylan esterase [Armatimonadetes bacterium]|nr:acetylxylan esterase [Armatimonadota bacterium]
MMFEHDAIRNTSMGEYLLRLFHERQPALPMTATNADELQSWQGQFRAKLWESMGKLPSQKCPLEPLIVERVDMGDYWREKVLLQSEPYMAIPAYLLLPSDLRGDEKRPAILACHGHGNGKDDVCGITHGERHRVQSIRAHNYAYAIQLVKCGYIVLAPDWRGFGERRLGGFYGGKDHCDVLLIKCLLFGMNPLGLNVWDAMRCLDYLQMRPEVDGERLGCVGLSYGGTITLFTAALDERIKAAVVTCYLNSFGGFALSMGNFCGVQVPFGILQYGDLGEVGALIAPRPLCIEAGRRDEGFPIEKTREAVAVVRKAYAVSNADERFIYDEFDGGHQWHGNTSIAFLQQWLPPTE